MSEDEFRLIFNRVRRQSQTSMLYSEPAAGGEVDMVVGLNGDKAIMHGGREVPLALLREHPVNEDWLLEMAAQPGIVAHATTKPSHGDGPKAP